MTRLRPPVAGYGEASRVAVYEAAGAAEEWLARVKGVSPEGRNVSGCCRTGLRG